MSEGATNTTNVLRYFQGFTRKFVNNSKGEGGNMEEAFEFFFGGKIYLRVARKDEKRK